MDIRTHRLSLGISQSRLARLASVSRFKICMYELGGGSLTSEEHVFVSRALDNEAARISAALTVLREEKIGEAN